MSSISGVVGADGNATFDGVPVPPGRPVHAVADGRPAGGEDVARLYAERGERCFESLRGPFAIAIWDAHQKKLVLARDAFGTKPLHHASDHGRFLFASDPAAILDALAGRPHVDPLAIDDVLAFGWTERRRTGYEEIERLDPGGIAVYRGGRLERRSWWSPPRAEPSAVAPVAVELERSVRASTDAGGVPGVLLRGGAGESALIEAASRVAGRPVRTFTARFDASKDLAQAVEETLAALDEPFADPELVLLRLACRAAREEVGVCLTADGCEEILGVGARHRWMRTDGARARGPLALLPFFRAGLAVLPPLAFPGLRSGMQLRLDTEERRYVSRLVATENRLRRGLLGPHRRAAHRENEGERELATDFGIAGTLDARMRRHDLRHVLPNRVLVRGQKAAAATGLELRHPFLDLAIAGRSAEMPAERAPSVEAPVDEWIRKELAPLVDGYLVGSRLAADGWLSQPRIAAVHRAHRSRRMELGRTLFALLALEIWYRGRILRIGRAS